MWLMASICLFQLIIMFFGLRHTQRVTADSASAESLKRLELATSERVQELSRRVDHVEEELRNVLTKELSTLREKVVRIDTRQDAAIGSMERMIKTIERIEEFLRENK
jgi:hypothetical protein